MLLENYNSGLLHHVPVLRAVGDPSPDKTSDEADSLDWVLVFRGLTSLLEGTGKYMGEHKKNPYFWGLKHCKVILLLNKTDSY